MFILNESFYVDYLQFKLRWARNMHKPLTYTSNMQFPHTIFWLVYEGSWRMVVQGQERVAKPGDLLIFPPDTLIGLKKGEEESIRYLSLCADLKIGNLDMVTLYGLPAATPLSDFPGLDSFKAVWLDTVQSFDELGELIAAKKPQPSSTSGHTHIIHTDISLSFLGLQGSLYRWLNQLMLLMRRYLPDEPLRFDHRIMKACDYVRHHIEKPLRLRELADHVHLSPSHFSYLFTKTLGLAPLEYVRRAKIQFAKEMLAHSSSSIKEIAEMIGYDEQSQLSRYFRQTEGMSPLQFRNAANAATSI